MNQNEKNKYLDYQLLNGRLYLGNVLHGDSLFKAVDLLLPNAPVYGLVGVHSGVYGLGNVGSNVLDNT